MHTFRLDPTLFPVLIESLASDPLWTFLAPIEIREPDTLPQFDLVTIQILNENNERRVVVPFFSRREFAEEFSREWNPEHTARLMIMHYCAGSHALDKLDKRNLNLVIDHGRQGVILQASIWRPAFSRYLKGSEIATPRVPIHLFQAADPDDFPILRDRITALLLQIPLIQMAWLMWVPATKESARQICLITASTITCDADRIRAALSLLADDLILPELTYLPIAFGTKEINHIPAHIPMFYSDELAKTLAMPMLRGN